MEDASDNAALGEAPLHAHEAVVVVDEQLLIVTADAAAEALFARPAAALLGRAFPMLLPERMRDACAAQMRAFVLAGAVRQALDCPVVAAVRAGEREFAVRTTLSRATRCDADGHGAVFVVSLRASNGVDADVAPLMRRLPALFDRAPVAIWATARRHRIVFANPACARLFGVADVAQLLGRSASLLLQPASRPPFRSAVRRATRGKPQVIRAAIERADGARRSVEVSIVALPDHGTGAAQMVITDVTEHESEAAALQRSRRELRQLSASLVQAREDERQSIARELHDELGQRLTALKLELIGMARHAGGAASGSSGRGVEAMLQMLDDTVASVRRIASDLRPLMLDDLGLTAAAEWLAHNFTNRTGIPCELVLRGEDLDLPDPFATAVFRVLQESLTNVARHAQATQVEATIEREEDDVVLTVQDNGRGFTLEDPRKPGSFGLVGLRERAYLLGGDVKIDSALGRGTTVEMRIPVRDLEATQ